MPGLVKLVNVGEHDFIEMYNGQRYQIPAGRSEFVPYGAMMLWMGDPDARDNPRDRARLDEYDRLRTKFSANSGMQGDTRPEWDDAKPQLQAFTQEGERITTVMDDPSGNNTPSAGEILSNEELSRRVAELSQLLLEQGAREAQQSAGNVSGPGTLAETPVATPDGTEASGPMVPDPITNPAPPEPDTTSQPPVDNPNRVKAGNARGKAQ